MSWERSEDERKVCKVLEGVAAKIGAKSIQAGERCFLISVKLYALIAFASGHCVRYAEDALCLPGHWGAEG